MASRSRPATAPPTCSITHRTPSSKKRGAPALAGAPRCPLPQSPSPDSARVADPLHIQRVAQRVAQPVAEEVEAEDGNQDRHAGEDADPPGLAHEVAALVQGGAPGRRPRSASPG